MENNRTINLSHSGSTGDILYALTVAKSFGMANLYLTTGPLLPEKMANAFIPLVSVQPYINVCKIHENERIDLDLDNFRGLSSLKYDFLSITSLSAIERYYNIATPWIHNIEPLYLNDIILNRTKRYHGNLDYYTLCTKYKDKITFLGYEDEHEHFCDLFNVNVKYKETKDFLEVAQFIKGSKLFVGNQSMCWGIAEGMKLPRYLEVCSICPNCMPVGGMGHCDWEDYTVEEIVEMYL